MLFKNLLTVPELMQSHAEAGEADCATRAGPGPARAGVAGGRVRAVPAAALTEAGCVRGGAREGRPWGQDARPRAHLDSPDGNPLWAEGGRPRDAGTSFRDSGPGPGPRVCHLVTLTTRAP